MNSKELQNRKDTDSKGIRTHNHLVLNPNPWVGA